MKYAIMYEDLFYTTVPPVWGPTFTPKKENANVFESEKQARNAANELATFKLDIVCL